MFSVDFIQHRDDMALPVFGYLAPFVHEGANGRFRQEREKSPASENPRGTQINRIFRPRN